MTAVGSIGQKTPRVDTLDKASGKTRYAGDLNFPDMVYAKAIFSQRPHARILSMNLSQAEQLDGVIRIFTADDIEGSNGFGATVPHQPILVPVGGVARFPGDALALVVAETEKIAQRAIELIQIEYENLPGVFSMEEAVSHDAPLIHDDSPENICATHEIVTGDVEEAFEHSDVVIEETFQTSLQEHAYIEPEAAVGVIDNQGQIVLYSCLQDPHYFAMDVSQAVGVPMSRLRIVATSLGGGFGGKDDVSLQAFVVLAVQKLQRPVKMVYTREESFISTVKRHPMKITVKLGADRDGTLRAMKGEILSDSGPYSGRSPVVITVAIHSLSGPYCIPHINLFGKTVYTNNPVGGACRGYGQPQSTFARELAMDRLAEALHMDPDELRRINFLKQGDPVGTSFVNLDAPVSMPRVLDKTLEQALPVKSSPDPHRSFGRGVACAMPMFDIAALPSLGLLGAGVSIQLMSDGTLKVYSTAVEMGQGVTTVLSQIAMEEFGLSADRVSVVLGDTDISQKSGPSTASRQTYVSGNALLAALKKLKERVSQKAGALLEEDPEKLLFRDGKILSPESEKAMTLAEVAKTCYYEGVDLREKSWFKATHAMIGHTFMATVADVEVDVKTGAVYIKRLINCHDIGRAINPEAVRGQLVGGGIQSMGWSMQEEFITEEGMTKTPSFSEYLVPTAMDIPAVETYLIEDPYPTGPYGAKGVGEHATICATPAIVSAINNATGHFFRDIPLTAEKIYWALGKK